ncbi:MAG: universal stress protein [Anaerolineae bacterium]|nr:universal stress protein [Anaerolineae bacterium]
MMAKKYRHILVPLDGSKLAELALEDAWQLAELNHAKITLLHVASPVEEVIGAGTDHPIFIDQQWESERVKALRYLSGLINQMPQGLEIYPEVEMGLAAETIVDYANHHDIDLIVMATHGRSGFRRLIYGSVAEAVLHEAHVPILMVRGQPQQAPSVAF